MKHIILSICIPTYNRLPYLKKQVDFLLKEYTPDIEIIISDNGSSDGTQDYLKSLNTNIITPLINKENIGAEGNMYRCVNVSHGDYVFFLGDDDPLEKGFVKYALDLIYNYHAAYYHFNYTAYDDKKNIISTTCGIADKLEISCRQLNTREITELVSKYFGPFLFISSNIYRRDIVLKSQAGCKYWVETLRLSIIAMLSGETYIDNDSKVLCGVNSSWTDRRGDVWFEAFPNMFDSLESYGLSKKEIKYIKDKVSAWCIFAYNRSQAASLSQINWSERIKKLSNNRVKFYIVEIYIKRAIRKIVNIVTGGEDYVAISDSIRNKYGL